MRRTIGKPLGLKLLTMLGIDKTNPVATRDEDVFQCKQCCANILLQLTHDQLLLLRALPLTLLLFVLVILLIES